MKLDPAIYALVDPRDLAVINGLVLRKATK